MSGGTNNTAQPVVRGCTPSQNLIGTGVNPVVGRPAHAGAQDSARSAATGLDLYTTSLGDEQEPTGNTGVCVGTDVCQTQSIETRFPSGQRHRRKRHGVITSSRLIFEELRDERVNHRCALITLTYARVNHWTPYDITNYLNALGTYCESRAMGLRVVWVAERGKLGGRLHYHLVVWWWRLRAGKRTPNLPMPDRSGMWRKGHSNIKEARNPVGYIAKYLSKDGHDTDAVPVGLRLWGCRGLGGDPLRELRWWRSPRWVRALVPLEDGVKRLRQGWWANASTRWAYRSPWGFDMDLLKPYWRGWSWDGVDMTGEAWAELGGGP